MSSPKPSQAGSVIVNRKKQLTMIRTFMIEFDYEGKKEYANVAEYKHSPNVFYVSTVPKDYSLPALRLILREMEERLEPTPLSPSANENLINIIVEKIREYISTH